MNNKSNNMKNNVLTIVILILTLISCKAQVAPLYRIDPELPEGTYYKDLDNDFDKFIGTWKWESNDSIITIVLQKKEDVYIPSNNQYEDYIVGEYKFTVNGNVIQDYLGRLNDPNLSGDDHHIAGNTILENGQLPVCDDCPIGERRIFLVFTDPEREYMLSALALRSLSQGQVLSTEPAQLHGTLFTFSTSVVPIDEPENIRIPFGEYIFVKQ
ncbi:MAG: DUF6705 family protein [Bacteroidota bacterium]